MKRFLLLVFISVFQFSLLAQDATTASAIAQRQESEERYKRLNADLESLLAANVSLQKKISALESELQKVREDQERNAGKNDQAENVRKLADAIEEVDRKRENDKKEILKEIGNLGKKLSVGTAPRLKPEVSSEASSGPDKGYPYTIQSGDTLLAILADFNAQFKAKGMKPVTMSQVTAANPNVDWNRLKIGQKIFIPAPE